MRRDPQVSGSCFKDLLDEASKMKDPASSCHVFRTIGSPGSVQRHLPKLLIGVGKCEEESGLWSPGESMCYPRNTAGSPGLVQLFSVSLL